MNRHYHSLMQALAVAMQHCWVWRHKSSQQPFTVKDLYETALLFDEERPLQRNQFFLVTREGAIGFSEGYECLTHWWYVPMEAGPERDRLIEDMRWELKAEFAAEEAIEKAVQERIAADKAQAAQETLTPPPPPITPHPLLTTVLVLLFMLLPTMLFAQQREGEWVDPVEYYHLNEQGGSLDLAALSEIISKADKQIVGMKLVPYLLQNRTKGETAPPNGKGQTSHDCYLYVNEPTKWTAYIAEGEYIYLKIYSEISADQLTLSYNSSTHQYGLSYQPSGIDRATPTEKGKKYPDKYPNAEVRAGASYNEITLRYDSENGLHGHFENYFAYKQKNVDILLCFRVEEVMVGEAAPPLTEEQRLELIEKMDNLIETLKEYVAETGDHAGPIPTTIINIVSIIGSVLIGNGVASVTGTSAGIFGGGGGAPTGGGGQPSPDMPSNALKKKEEEETPEPPNEPTPSEDPLGENRKYWDRYMKENADGTLTMRDPITGKPLTYYPTEDGGYESEMGTHYTQESLAENVRYRAENSDYFKDIGDKAAKDVAEQRAQNAKLNAEQDAKAQAYREQKAAEEAAAKQAAEQKQAQLDKLAKQFGLEGEDAKNEYLIHGLLEKEQASAELEHERQMKEAAYYDAAYKTAKVIDDAATTTINVMGELVPGGRTWKNIYTVAHSVVASGSEAHAKGEDMGKAILNGAIDGGLGVLQNQAGNIASNVWTEGIIVVGVEGVKEGMKSISNGDNPSEVLDKMKKAITHKTNYFLIGKQAEKVVGWVNKSAGQSLSPKGVNFKNDTGLRFGENTAKSIQKALSKTDKIDLTKGIPSAVQEVGATYTGNWGRDSKADFVTDEAIPGIVHDVEYYTNLVKDFSNAASKARNMNRT